MDVSLTYSTQYMGEQMNSKPSYLYEKPMFAVTVTPVVVIDMGVLVIEEDGKFRFPTGHVKAGQETVEFAVLRHIKRETGLTIRKNELQAVNISSEPERSEHKNEIDIGFYCSPKLDLERFLADIEKEDITKFSNVRWKAVNFETGEFEDEIKIDEESKSLLYDVIKIFY